MIERRPIRSPIQPKDLEPAPQTVSLNEMFSELMERINEFRSEMDNTIQQAHETLHHIRTIQKGDTGEPGEKGESVFSESDFVPYLEWMLDEVKSHIPEPVHGKDGKTPVFGIDYFTPTHKKEIIANVLKNIRQPEDGKTPTVDHQAIADMAIKKIVEGKMLTQEHITGLTDTLTSYRAQLAGKHYGKDTWARGGGDTVKAGSNVTITSNPDGTKSISASGTGGTVFSEVLMDSGDHKNFTSLHTINTIYSLQDGSGHGIPLKDASGNTNYTFTGTTLTLGSADANLASIGINIIYA